MRTIVRLTIGLICRLVGLRNVRYRWLAHYLIGNGSPLRIPTKVVQAALWREEAMEYQGEPYKFDSSADLFWLVGTMTFEVVDTPAGCRVVGIDCYDWHPNRFSCPRCGAWGYDIEGGVCQWCGAEAVEDWWWTTTPLPGWVASVLRAAWPACRPYVEIGDTGRLAVSNGFWPWIGGREFCSVLDVPLGVLPSWRDTLSPLEGRNE